jgi:hypothetical protein
MDTQISEYSTTAAALAELRQKYAQAVFDTSTPAGMAKAIAARRELREVRVNLEKLRKELKAPALERSRLIDAEAKTLTVQIEEMETPIDAQIKAEEQRKADEKAERERIEREKLEALQKSVAVIRHVAVACVGKTSDEIAAHIGSLESFQVDEGFGALQGDAHAAKAETLVTLAGMHAAALAHEAEAERLRIEREELEAQRKAQDEQAAKDRAEMAKIRADVEARQAAAKAEMEKQMEEERQKVAAERAEVEKVRIAEAAKQQEIERNAAAMRAAEEAKAKAIRDAEEAELARQRAEIEEQRRKVEAERLAQEEAARKVQSGYQMLESFVDRFGAEKEFQTISRTISKWLDGKKEEVAA